MRSIGEDAIEAHQIAVERGLVVHTHACQRDANGHIRAGWASSGTQARGLGECEFGSRWAPLGLKSLSENWTTLPLYAALS